MSAVSIQSRQPILYPLSKRVLDVCFSLVALVIFVIPMLIVAVFVGLESRGPVLFRQTRVGRNGKTFKIIKFRTMVRNAALIGPAVTAADDTRMTRLGRWLRATKIDELPQLWNVLIGDMSLVGPRPQVPRYVDQFPGDVRDLILSVAPGITGPTAIQFRHEESILDARANPEEFYIDVLLPIKCELDAEYVRNRSFSNDVRAFFSTVGIFTGGVWHRFLRRPIGRQIELSPYHQGIIDSYSAEHPQMALVDDSRHEPEYLAKAERVEA